MANRNDIDGSNHCRKVVWRCCAIFRRGWTAGQPYHICANVDMNWYRRGTRPSKPWGHASWFLTSATPRRIQSDMDRSWAEARLDRITVSKCRFNSAPMPRANLFEYPFGFNRTSEPFRTFEQLRNPALQPAVNSQQPFAFDFESRLLKRIEQAKLLSGCILLQAC